SFSDMLDGGSNWRNRSELLGVLMRWNPDTPGGSRFFVTKAEYHVSALDGRDGYVRMLSMLPLPHGNQRRLHDDGALRLSRARKGVVTRLHKPWSSLRPRRRRATKSL